jgi:hypothetical protein
MGHAIAYRSCAAENSGHCHNSQGHFTHCYLRTKMTSLRRNSVSDCLSFGVERRAESIGTNSRGKSARRIPMCDRQKKRAQALAIELEARHCRNDTWQKAVAVRNVESVVRVDADQMTTAAWHFECAIEKVSSCRPHKAALSPIIRPTGVGRIGPSAILPSGIGTFDSHAEFNGYLTIHWTAKDRPICWSLALSLGNVAPEHRGPKETLERPGGGLHG